jgi:2-amino-4-hydroxy-6-hydroxymethyldihydropteridine diphosphokinase
MHKYYLHLGSNQGDRFQILNTCVEQIDKHIGQVEDKSPIYETEPWGLKDQSPFLNQALLCHSSLSPADLLAKAKDIERSIGKEKEERWGPRLLDIDILYCDDIILEGNPQIPHPEIANRNFVLVPLMSIAGDHVDPRHQKTIEELYDNCEDECEVYLWGADDEEE